MFYYKWDNTHSLTCHYSHAYTLCQDQFDRHQLLCSSHIGKSGQETTSILTFSSFNLNESTTFSLFIDILKRSKINEKGEGKTKVLGLKEIKLQTKISCQSVISFPLTCVLEVDFSHWN